MKENLRKGIILKFLKLFRVVEDVPEHLKWVGYYSFVEDIAVERMDYLLNKVIFLFLFGISIASVGYKSHKLVTIVIVGLFFVLIGTVFLITPFESFSTGSIRKFEIDIEKKVDRIFGCFFLVLGVTFQIIFLVL